MRFVVFAAVLCAADAFAPAVMFKKTDSGEQCSDHGYIRLTSQSECEQAAAYTDDTGDVTVDAPESNEFLPYGCIMDGGGNLRLNAELPATGQSASHPAVKQLCKEVTGLRLAADMCGGPANRVRRPSVRAP